MTLMPQQWTTFFVAILIYAALAPNQSFAQAYVQGSVVSTGGADIPAATVVIERQDGGSGGTSPISEPPDFPSVP